MLRAILTTLGLFVLVSFVGVGGVLFVFYKYGQGLPDYRQLADYEPPVMTRVHAGDGRLLAEFAMEKRVFIPIKAMPKQLINAFLAAEDKNFYTHSGVDFILHRFDATGDSFQGNPADRCSTLHPTPISNVLSDANESTICESQVSDRR